MDFRGIEYHYSIGFYDCLMGLKKNLIGFRKIVIVHFMGLCWESREALVGFSMGSLGLQ